MKSYRGMVLLIANIFTIVLPALWLIGLTFMARSGQSGTEFIAIMLLPLLILGYCVAVVNVVVIISFLRKRVASKKHAIVAFTMLLISIGIITWPGVSWLYISQRNKSPFVASVGTTVGRASELISSCSLKGVSFVNLGKEEFLVTANNSPTGIVRVELENYVPHTLFVSERARAEIEPLLQDLEEMCPDTRIFYNGAAFIDENGNWRSVTQSVIAE